MTHSGIMYKQFVLNILYQCDHQRDKDVYSCAQEASKGQKVAKQNKEPHDTANGQSILQVWNTQEEKAVRDVPFVK